MNRKPASRIRPANPNHHPWNNNGTWWCHYAEHLPDYTKRHVRRSLLTKDQITTQILRDAILFEICIAGDHSR